MVLVNNKPKLLKITYTPNLIKAELAVLQFINNVFKVYKQEIRIDSLSLINALDNLKNKKSI